MNIPIQASSVNRSLGDAIRAHTIAGVTASGDGCSTGYWCCSNYAGYNTCVSCGTWPFPCVTDQTSTCQAAGLHPYDGC